MDPDEYPEVDRSVKQISFQLHPRFKNQRTYQIPARREPKNSHSFQYDFSLEERLQEIFLKRQKNEETDEEVVIDEGDDQTISAAQKTPPPIPPRSSKTTDQNDSGVSSSNSENGTEDLLTLHNSSKILQPSPSSLAQPIIPPRKSNSVIDVFENFHDDPWEAARISSINEHEELKSIFTHSEPAPSPAITSTPVPKKQQKQLTDNLIVADIESLLAQRRNQNEQERKQNFSKSALAALNSLPVIENRSSTPTQRGISPISAAPARPKTEQEKFVDQLAEMGYNRCIIAKATQILGDDRSKIMDYLNAYSVLIEKGYPSGKVLQVLQICENSLEESKIFFEKSPKYIEMGFDLTAIRKALIRYPNEPRLQLESLVQGRT
ncbi:Oidioi.mRNA.OKI2018_I69.XSR.g15281.t1.cds [Oikopleura dioica]|uniref:Oidioi.mRNA.OKI2018_I69.XSR.g15281.t1.cds n=1 Tax=Oikopleura dioica TaxID=34765 RepID=A0ABN7SE58_OIKDI|nr:Oidioi.mRNA.OKI2018_I69.XSR.g15281.t1.cds [Oikopleura dioica]